MSGPHITHLFRDRGRLVRWTVRWSDGDEWWGDAEEVRRRFTTAGQTLPEGWETAEPGWWAQVDPPVKRDPLPTLERWLADDGDRYEWVRWRPTAPFPAHARVTVTFDEDDTPHVTVKRLP